MIVTIVTIVPHGQSALFLSSTALVAAVVTVANQASRLLEGREGASRATLRDFHAIVQTTGCISR